MFCMKTSISPVFCCDREAAESHCAPGHRHISLYGTDLQEGFSPVRLPRRCVLWLREECTIKWSKRLGVKTTANNFFEVK